MPNVMSRQCVALPYGKVPPSRYSSSGDTQRPDLQRAALLYSAPRTQGIRSWTRHRTDEAPYVDSAWALRY